MSQLLQFHQDLFSVSKNDYPGRCPSANIAVKNLISYNSFLDKTNSQEASLAAGAECQWVQYTACLLICTSPGPILY